jgi:hypothetical protein
VNPDYVEVGGGITGLLLDPDGNRVELRDAFLS